MIKEKTYYTIDEVHLLLDNLDEMKVKYNRLPLKNRKTFFVAGFECIDSFCLTSKGWVQSYDECYDHLVRSVISTYGSQEDKVKFNSFSMFGKNNAVSVSRKDIARDKKTRLKNRKKRMLKLKNRKKRKIGLSINSHEKKNNKEHQRALKEIKASGISILRRNKKNLWNNIERNFDELVPFILIQD